MPPSFRPLPVDTVDRLLAALPPLRTGDVGMLSAVRTDLARAIASGQDAGQLASDLSTPAAWLGLDLRRAAGPTPPTAPPPAPPAPAAEEAAVPPPAWAVAAAQAAVQAKSALRVAVLDRDPASMPSLRLPAWAQGQQAVATYGPLLVESAASQITFQKWLIIYIIPVQMVSFVQGATTLFIAPLAATGSEKTVTLAAGSVWVNVTPLAAGAPANSFAGVAIQSGSITSDRNLTFGGTTVTIPAGATVTLAVTPAAPAASGNPAVQVAPPATITFTFPGAGAATASVAPFTAQICGETFDAEPNGQPLVYNDTVKTLAIPCDTNQTRFAPVTQPGTLAQLHGTATLLAAGWALQVTQAAPPALGNAAGAGSRGHSFGVLGVPAVVDGRGPGAVRALAAGVRSVGRPVGALHADRDAIRWKRSGVRNCRHAGSHRTGGGAQRGPGSPPDGGWQPRDHRDARPGDHQQSPGQAAAVRVWRVSTGRCSQGAGGISERISSSTRQRLPQSQRAAAAGSGRENHTASRCRRLCFRLRRVARRIPVPDGIPVPAGPVHHGRLVGPGRCPEPGGRAAGRSGVAESRPSGLAHDRPGTRPSTAASGRGGEF